jgi:hypothetical protein
VGRVRVDPEGPLDHDGDALHRPELVGKAIGSGALRQHVQQLLALRVRQLAWTTGDWLRGSSPVSTVRPGLLPAMDGSDRGLHPTRHLAQAEPLAEEGDGTATASF